MYASRYRRILRFSRRVIGALVWWEVVLPRLGLGGLSLRTRPERLRRIAVSYRALAVRMGGVLIKIGQFLSARMDVLPQEITSQLAGLQDEVDAESFDAIRRVVEEEFAVPLEQKFEAFDPRPVASASIGQVHAARLCLTGSGGVPCPTVMVKVQRSHIREIVESDLAAIRKAGSRIRRFRFVSRHVDIASLIGEFSRSLYEEIDYLHEGENAERFARNFASHPGVRIPGVIRSHTSRRVLTLEDVSAIKISDYPALSAAGIDRGAVARRLVETYLKQIFEDGFFHADPHPGNLFVQPAPAGAGTDAWKLVFVDFGMTGTLTPRNYAGLREALVAVGTRNPARLVAAFRTLGILLPEADTELIARAVRKVFESVWGKSMQEILSMSGQEIHLFAHEFRDLLYDMPFQVPENLILLGRCMGILSGMAVGLDPAFNPWDTLAPYATRFVGSAGGGASAVLEELAGITRILAALPSRTDSLLTRLEEGRFDVRIPGLPGSMAKLARALRGLSVAVIFSAGLLAGTQLHIAGHAGPALAFAVLDAVLALWFLLRRRG